MTIPVLCGDGACAGSGGNGWQAGTVGQKRTEKGGREKGTQLNVATDPILAAMVPVLGAAATAGKLGPKAAKLAGKVTPKMDEAAAGAKQFFGKADEAMKSR